MGRQKLSKSFGEEAFGVPDVPDKMGHRRQQWLDGGCPWSGKPSDRRSWKRRRKTKWRIK